MSSASFRLPSCVRRAGWFFAWYLARFGLTAAWMLRGPRRRCRRVLVVYDCSTQPLSIGDVLICTEAGLVLKARHDAEVIDFAFLYDPQFPGHRDPTFAHVDGDNVLTHLSVLLQTAQVNPHLGSLLVFSERSALEAHVAQALSHSAVWPSLPYYASGQYFYYRLMNDLLHEHFSEHGRVPELQSRPALRTWAQDFLQRHARGKLTLSAQVRRNHYNPARNSDYDTWIGFFQRAALRAPAVHFVLLCDHHEIDERFVALPNVTVAKRYCTSVEQDLALIEASAGHLGASSGPSTMVMFSEKPYALFGWIATEHRYRDLGVDGDVRRFFFARPHQRLIVDREDAARLDAEFEGMLASLGHDGRG